MSVVSLGTAWRQTVKQWHGFQWNPCFLEEKNLALGDGASVYPFVAAGSLRYEKRRSRNLEFPGCGFDCFSRESD